MSGVIELMFEQERYGLSNGPDRKVCSNHISESAIKTFIRTKGTLEQCDYCQKNRNVVSLEDLMKFLLETVMYFYTDPAGFSSHDDGEYAVSHRDGWEILQEEFMLDINDNDLFFDMEQWIDSSKAWADEKAMYDEGHYARPNSWANFCYLVKHKARYLFQDYKNEFDIHSQKPLEILREVERMIKKYKLIKELPSGERLFRCRQHSSKEIISVASQMCSPNIEFCRNPNRMSPAGISMFYCAFDLETTHRETLDKKSKDKYFTTASFILKNNINVIDFSSLPKIPSPFNQRKRRLFEDAMFLMNFVTDLTKPVERDGKVHIDYVPTQIVTEYIRFMFNQNVDGIIYPSSRNTGSCAMVLFYDYYDSLHYLDFEQDSIIKKSIRSYKTI